MDNGGALTTHSERRDTTSDLKLLCVSVSDFVGARNLRAL